MAEDKTVKEFIDALLNMVDDFSFDVRKFELALKNAELTVQMIAMNLDITMPEEVYNSGELMDNIDFLKDSRMPEIFRMETAIKMLAERVLALNNYWEDMKNDA